MSKIKIGGVYVHFKSPEKRYKVIGIAKHTETEEDMVVYESLYKNAWAALCVRPLKMFIEKVEWPKDSGKKVSRFTLETQK